MVTNLTSMSATNPDIKAPANPDSVAVVRSTFFNSSNPAAKVIGRLSKNEYLNASTLVIPINKAPISVKPLLEIPGKTAIAWKRPTIKASRYVMSFSVLFPEYLSESHKAAAVTKKNTPINFCEEKAASTFDSKKSPTIPAGIDEIIIFKAKFHIFLSDLTRPYKMFQMSLKSSINTAKKVAM